MTAASPDSLTAPSARQPRFRWRRIALTCTALLLIVVVITVCWGWLAQNRLTAEIARLRAAGERILPEDFVRKLHPNEPNAANLIVAAAEAIDSALHSDDWRDELTDSVTWTLEDLRKAQQFFDLNSHVLVLFDQAQSAGDAVWPLHPIDINYDLSTRHWSEARKLGKFFDLEARFRHQQGDHDRSLRAMHRLEQLARAQSLDCGLIAHLVAIACYGLASRMAENSAPTFCAHPHCAAEDLVPADRASLESYIRLGLDESLLQASLHCAAEHERALVLSIFRGVTQGEVSVAALSAAATTPATPPSIWDRLQLQALLPYISDLALEHLVHSTPPAAFRDLDRYDELNSIRIGVRERRIYDVLDDVPGTIGDLFEMIGSMEAESSARAFYLHVRMLAQRRLAVVRWALRLYELDHGGMPETLDVLVPDYLPRLPEDPFSKQGVTFGYRPVISPAVLYSISYDGEDDGGTRGSEFDDEDIVMFLNGEGPEG